MRTMARPHGGHPMHDLVMRKCLTTSKAWKEHALERAAELQAQINEKVAWTAELQAQINEKVAWSAPTHTDEAKSKAVAELEVPERPSTFERVNPIHGSPEPKTRFRPKPTPQEEQ